MHYIRHQYLRGGKMEEKICRFSYIFTACFICILLSSCSPFPLLNLSSSQNVPLLSRRNQLRIEVGTGTQYIGIQSSYALSNHFIAMENFSYGQSLYPVRPPLGA